MTSDHKKTKIEFCMLKNCFFKHLPPQIRGAGHGTLRVGLRGIHVLCGGHWYGLQNHPGYRVLGIQPGNGL